MEPSEVFGTILKQIRKQKKISQEELAFRSDLDRTYISMLERGIYQPTLNSLFAIAEGLEMKASELILIIEEKKKDDTN